MQIPLYDRLVNTPPQDQPGSIPPYESTFTVNPVGGSNNEKALLLKLQDLVKQKSPSDTIPDPYTVVALKQNPTPRMIPFIQATIRISPYESDEIEQTFRDVWVLWDTGAQVSQILSGQLRDEIKTDSESGVVQTEGFASVKVR